MISLSGVSLSDLPIPTIIQFVPYNIAGYSVSSDSTPVVELSGRSTYIIIGFVGNVSIYMSEYGEMYTQPDEVSYYLSP